MSERVIRIRHSPGGYDENNDPIPSSESRKLLTARGVAPGASTAHKGEGRNGQKVEHTVYFTAAVDLTNEDELQVRGDIYAIRVLEWQSGYNTGRRGTVVLTSRTEG